MEKLIDVALEDDSLVSPSGTPSSINAQPLGYIPPLSSTVVSEDNHMRAKEQESTVSGSMERSECAMPLSGAVKLSAVGLVSRSSMPTLPEDGQQDIEHDSHLNGLIRETPKEPSGAEKTIKGLPYRSGKKSRSARSSSNLRKSLAWDKAFSTGKGLLDVDELPLAIKTPGKPLEFRSFDIPENLRKLPPSPLPVLERVTPNFGAVDHTEGIASSPVQGPIRPECLTYDLPNSPTLEDTSSKGSSPVVPPSHVDTKISKLDRKRSVSVGETVKADVQKASRLRLPSAFTGKKGKGEIPPKPVSEPQNNLLRRCKSSSSVLPASASAAFSKKVSSVSKKVKDAFGRVMPGNSPDANKKKDAEAATKNQEVIPGDQLPKGKVIPSLKGSPTGKDNGVSSKKGSERRSFYNTQVSQLISRNKAGPAGSQVPPVEKYNHVNVAQNSEGPSSSLRSPSPKIGFFDKPQRPAAGGNSSTLLQRVLGAASTNKTNHPRKGLPPRPLPSGRTGKSCAKSSSATVAGQLPSSGIPSAPHLRPFGKPAKGLATSVSAPTSPYKQHLRTENSNLRNPPQRAFQNDLLESRDCQSDQALDHERPLQVDAQPAMERPFDRSSVGFEAGVVLCSLGGHESPSKPVKSKPIAAQSLSTSEISARNLSPGSGSKHPLAVNVGLLNGINKRTSTPLLKERNTHDGVCDQPASETTCKENRRGSDGQVARTHDNSKPQPSKSTSSNSVGQLDAYSDLFSEERLRVLEAAGQESFLKKSGAVQHSPPNKISPNKNPWSPVKRSGQQPGPFDCTKKYSNACMGQ